MDLSCAQAAPCPIGKGASLDWLSTRVQLAQVPAFIKISAARWYAHPCEVLSLCHRTFEDQLVAVRSDAYAEDQAQTTRAGEFCTLLNVASAELPESIERVAQSMPGHPKDSILIQRMVLQPRFVGVVSSHRIADGAPWYCIELAHDDTAAVTGGRATGRQVAVARSRIALGVEPLDEPERSALALVQEVEGLVEGIPLEIEFALSESPSASCVLEGHLLQMRPLTTARYWSHIQNAHPPAQLPSLAFLNEVDTLSGIEGDRTILSLMSDWNPAELIGAHPRPLALSLFKELIADGVWWQARASLGYAAPPQKNIHLLQVLQGRPFVDVRRSANSLIPAQLPAATRRTLVNHWLALLEKEPALHDKVEFQVFRTVRDFSAPSAFECANVTGLPSDALKQWEAALGRLTAHLMNMGADSPLIALNGAISVLELDDLEEQTASSLLQRCQQGTAAFASIARIAFAAEAQLRSAVQRGALAPDRALALRAAARSSPTHSANSSTALGHLRPGTFDITQPTWSANADLISGVRSPLSPPASFSLAPPEARLLEKLAAEADLPFCAQQWVRFAQVSASSREWGKFVFSRHLSAALEGIAAEAMAVGVAREQASWLTMSQWRQGHALAPAARAVHWTHCAEQARIKHHIEAQLITGPVLRQERDRYVADSLGSLPNFIGMRAVHGPLIVITDTFPQPSAALQGAVVLVSKADPGFDWLFDYGIVGLITQWGGANSHMAIRCAEFGLAAAIGCGPSVYARALSARSATIDPGTESIWFE